MTSFDRIENEAAHWAVREDRGLDLKERAALEHWLSQDVAHRVSYLRIKAAWQRTDRLSALGPSLPRPRPSLSRRIAMALPGTVKGVGLAASVLLIVAVVAWQSRPRNQIIATASGQHRSVTLSDGTRIELNGDTRLKTAQAGAGRAVTLDHGLAFFEVVHDALHPFVVYAGNRKITDLGTKFSVARNGDKVEIVVQEGRVRVDFLGADAGAPQIADQRNPVQARGAAVPDVKNSSGAGQPPSRAGLLIFNDEALDDVAREFNRYNKKQIHVAANARGIKIGGSFRVDNVDRFKVLLEQGFDVKVEESNGDIFVTR